MKKPTKKAIREFLNGYDLGCEDSGDWREPVMFTEQEYYAFLFLHKAASLDEYVKKFQKDRHEEYLKIAEMVGEEVEKRWKSND